MPLDIKRFWGIEGEPVVVGIARFNHIEVDVNNTESSFGTIFEATSMDAICSIF